MNEARLLKAMGFPKATQIMKTLPYNQMENKLTSAQKKIISDHVVSRGIRILATIQTSNTNINVFESESERYDSIVFLAVNVKDLKKSAQIYKVFMSIMPNPLVILFFNENRTKWIFALHEKKKDGYLKMKDMYEISETVTLEQVQEKVHFESLQNQHLKAFYRSWIEQLLSLELYTSYQVNRSVTLEKNILQQLRVLENEITYYVDQAKKESQLNKRIEHQLKANELKQKKQCLIESN